LTGWIILGVIAAVLLILCLLPLSLHISYGDALLIEAFAGPVRIPICPKEKKEGQQPEEPAAATKKKNRLEKPNVRQLRYALSELPPILVKALKRTKNRVRIRPLHVCVIFGGDDPADVAEQYGKAQALCSALLPMLERLVRIRDREIFLATDYDSEVTLITCDVFLRILTGDVLLIALCAGASLIRFIIGYRKLSDPIGNTLAAPNTDKTQQAETA